jgi:hypothetical protein
LTPTATPALIIGHIFLSEGKLEERIAREIIAVNLYHLQYMRGRGRGLGKSTIKGLAEVQSRSEIQARIPESGLGASNNSYIPPIEPEGQRPTAPYFL